MKWKTLGNALLVTAGLFCLTGLTIFLTTKFPLVMVALLFVLIVAWTYNAMRRSEDAGDDNDRMSWNYDNDDEEEEEEQ